ncbi:MAG: hypothetical protein UY65_C0016G0009 [Parcubacteria group bacterium GW2011_GWA2_51_12]|nr:MAG: hypothetical protein UY65_C0016G0009 [Parcubacteria group bacterium GW2011_GWA2_51_12]
MKDFILIYIPLFSLTKKHQLSLFFRFFMAHPTIAYPTEHKKNKPQTSDHQTSDNDFGVNFATLREKVLERRPVLREIIEKRGHKDLFTYAQDYLDVNLNETILARQPEFLAAFSSEVEKRLGKEVAKSATEQLRKYYFVSTADHHGPICHPFFLNSNLVTAMTCLEQSDPILQNVIVLACANVSQNNSSFPRGLLFQTNGKENPELNRLPILPAHSRLSPVFKFRSYLKSEIEKLAKLLRRKAQNKEIPQTVSQKVTAVLEEIYQADEVLALQSYSDQITLTNFRLWKKFFGEHEKIKPNLIYLEEEAVVSRLLVDHHLAGNTPISKILLGEKESEMLVKHFDGVEGGFDLGRKQGTYLFWALPEGEKYRIPLWREGGELVSEDGTFRVKLEPQAIKQGLESKILIPSMLLSYLLLSFYYGLKCLGGFCQVNYLTAMKDAYLKLLVDLGEADEAKALEKVQTKELGEDLTIAFLEHGERKIALATGLDLVIYGKPDAWKILKNQARNITIAEALDPMMPEFYRVMYGTKERDEQLMAITAEQILKHTGLSQKIEACAILRD